MEEILNTFMVVVQYRNSTKDLMNKLQSYDTLVENLIRVLLESKKRQHLLIISELITCETNNYIFNRILQYENFFEMITSKFADNDPNDFYRNCLISDFLHFFFSQAKGSDIELSPTLFDRLFSKLQFDHFFRLAKKVVEYNMFGNNEYIFSALSQVFSIDKFPKVLLKQRIDYFSYSNFNKSKLLELALFIISSINNSSYYEWLNEYFFTLAKSVDAKTIGLMINVLINSERNEEIFRFCMNRLSLNRFYESSEYEIMYLTKFLLVSDDIQVFLKFLYRVLLSFLLTLCTINFSCFQEIDFLKFKYLVPKQKVLILIIDLFKHLLEIHKNNEIKNIIRCSILDCISNQKDILMSFKVFILELSKLVRYTNDEEKNSQSWLEYEANVLEKYMNNQPYSFVISKCDINKPQQILNEKDLIDDLFNVQNSLDSILAKKNETDLLSLYKALH